MGEFWEVPRAWESEVAVCAAGGDSLTTGQLRRIHGKARLIAVSDVYRLAPWADVLYSCDLKWWVHHWPKGAGVFPGLKVSLDDSIPDPWDVKILRRSEEKKTRDPAAEERRIASGFDPDPSRLRTGKNSGYQAVHLAAHFGVRKIILLGYDMKYSETGRSHWFGDHPPGLQAGPELFPLFIELFRTLAPELEQRGIEVVNCSPGSALDAFPMAPLEEVL